MSVMPVGGPTTVVADPQNDDLLRKINTRFNQAYGGVHQRWRDRATHFYALYHNYTQWRDRTAVDRRDRDLGLRDAKREWGAELFIPYSFATVETILARMLSQNPTMLVLPRNRESEENIANIKAIVQAQQTRMNYNLILQDIARDALQMGLGVQKMSWRRERQQTQQLAPRQMRAADQSEWVVGPATIDVDDPEALRVDPFDWIWDPFGDSPETIEWCIHRVWRSSAYVKAQLASGYWTGVTPDQISSSAGTNAYEDAWLQRMTIQGYPSFKAGDTNEVWEYHDGRDVVTVLGRQWIVRNKPNPAWHGEMPFQVYRPTRVGGQMAGIGEIEPIEDLQLEMNTLRSQRRDNATFVLQRSYFYADGMIDPSDFKTGPGIAVPVLGDPRENVFPMPVSDIPNSSYQEEQRLQADIERATGIDDSLSGAGQATQQTATGVQLVQAAANLRIQLKTRGAETELVREGARQMLALDQQMIRTQRDVRIPSEPTPGEPDRTWAWLKVGPNELAGEFDIDVEGGSMAPENVPQQRSDAQLMLAVAGNPQVGQMLDPTFVARFVLKNLGVNDPSVALVQQQSVPAPQAQQVLKGLGAAGVSPALLQRAASDLGVAPS
jgi:hypothetical protein